MVLTVSQLTCKRCGYKWLPKAVKLPERCASGKCNSPYWNKPRRKKVTRKAA